MKMSDLIKLNQLQYKVNNKKMSIKTTYKFTRLFKELNEHAKFFQDTISNLIKEYGERDENGEFVLTENKAGIVIQKDKQDECIQKMNELDNLEITLQYIPTFTLDELDTLELSMNEMEVLMPLIDEE